VAQIAPNTAPVLITGDAGSGRESFARYIHMLGHQAENPFITLAGGTTTNENAAGLLFGSELSDRRGVLEAADNSTLFISELADLAPEAQRLLLGAMEQGSFYRVGGSKPVAVNLRLIASTRPGDQPGLRDDLRTRCSVLKLDVPALREYTEDVPELLRYFVDQLVDTQGLTFRKFGVATQNLLRNYPWPGNIQEMKNLVHRLLITGGDEEITLAELEKELAPATIENESGSSGFATARST